MPQADLWSAIGGFPLRKGEESQVPKDGVEPGIPIWNNEQVWETSLDCSNLRPGGQAADVVSAAESIDGRGGKDWAKLTTAPTNFGSRPGGRLGRALGFDAVARSQGSRANAVSGAGRAGFWPAFNRARTGYCFGRLLAWWASVYNGRRNPRIPSAHRRGCLRPD
jgi:hypothetical protein